MTSFTVIQNLESRVPFVINGKASTILVNFSSIDDADLEIGMLIDAVKSNTV